MGKSKFFRRCGVGKGVEVLIRIPKETYNTCNFSGGGDPDLLTSTSLWIQENR